MRLIDITERQVIFAHMVAIDPVTGTAMGLGRTSLVITAGTESLKAQIWT